MPITGCLRRASTRLDFAMHPEKMLAQQIQIQTKTPGKLQCWTVKEPLL